MSAVRVEAAFVPDLHVRLNATVVVDVEDPVKDVYLVTKDNKRYPVNKQILASASGYFKAVFRHTDPDLPRPVYRVPGCISSDGLGRMLRYIEVQQTQVLRLSDDNAVTMAAEADFLDIEEVLEECIKYMLSRLSTENAIGLWQFGLLYSMPELAEAAQSFLYSHFTQISLQDEFLELNYVELSTILGSTNLGNSREEELWMAISRWAEVDPGRHKLVKDLSKHVIFNLMDSDFRTKHVERSPLYNLIDKDWASELLILFGGFGYDSSCVTIYNSTTDRWRKIDPHLKDHGDGIQAVFLAGQVFIINSFRSLSFWRFDLRKRTLEEVPYMDQKRRMPAITTAKDCIYALGGSYLTTCEVFNPMTNQWTEMWHRMREGRAYASAAIVSNRIYVFGGLTLDNHKCATKLCEVFDPIKSFWGQIAPMSVARARMGCVVLDGEIYITGGTDNCQESGDTAQCEKFTPSTGKWSQLPDMIVPRSGHAAVVLEQVVFVIGGNTDRAEWLDLDNWMWVESEPLPSSLWGAGGCVIQL